MTGQEERASEPEPRMPYPQYQPSVERDYGMWIPAVLIGLCIAVPFSFMVPVHMADEHTVIDTIVYCNAPFGTYWVDTYGYVSFLAGRIDSDLTESYTVKYLKGNEVKTLLLRATDDDFSDISACRVFLSDQASFFQLDIWNTRYANIWGLNWHGDDPNYILIIPNPSLYGYDLGEWGDLELVE